MSSIFSPSASVGSKAGRRTAPSTGVPTVRPPYRTRTTSASSSTSSWLGSTHARDPVGFANTSKVPLFLPDVSQSSLENVVHSRLVETFLAITLPVSGAESGANMSNGTCRDDEASPSSPRSPSSAKSSISRDQKNASGRRNATDNTHVAGAVTSPQRNSASSVTGPAKGGASVHGGYNTFGKQNASPSSTVRNSRTRGGTSFSSCSVILVRRSSFDLRILNIYMTSF